MKNTYARTELWSSVDDYKKAMRLRKSVASVLARGRTRKAYMANGIPEGQICGIATACGIKCKHKAKVGFRRVTKKKVMWSYLCPQHAERLDGTGLVGERVE